MSPLHSTLTVCHDEAILSGLSCSVSLSLCLSVSVSVFCLHFLPFSLSLSLCLSVVPSFSSLPLCVGYFPELMALSFTFTHVHTHPIPLSYSHSRGVSPFASTSAIQHCRQRSTTSPSTSLRSAPTMPVSPHCSRVGYESSATRASQNQIMVKTAVCCRRRLSHTAILTVILALTSTSEAALSDGGVPYVVISRVDLL